MKNINKTIKISGILCFVMALFDVGILTYAIVSHRYDAFTIVSQSVCIALSIATGIAYLVLSFKKQNYLLEHKNAFFWITIVNIINSFLTWIITFWVQIAVTQCADSKKFQEMYTNLTSQNKTVSPEEKESIEIQTKAEKLSSEIAKLDEQKNKGEITEEEYNEKRQILIDKYV